LATAFNHGSLWWKKDELWQVLRERSRALVLHGDAGLDLNLVVVIREPSEAAAIAAEGRIYGAALYFLDDSIEHFFRAH